MRKTYRLRPSIRSLWLLAAALQLVLPGATAWADALLAARASRVVVHIEAATTPGCTPGHSADCGLCRYLVSAGGISEAAPDPATPSSWSAPPIMADVAPRATSSYALPPARAPPQAS